MYDVFLKRVETSIACVISNLLADCVNKRCISLVRKSPIFAFYNKSMSRDFSF